MPGRRGDLAPATLALMIALSAALVACESPTVRLEAPGIDPTNLTDGLIFHWPLGKRLVLYVDTTTQPAGSDLQAAVISGLEKWRAVIYYREFDFSLTTDPALADVTVHYKFAPRVVQTVPACDANPVGVGGFTYLCTADSGDSAFTLRQNSGAEGHVKIDVFVDRKPSLSNDAFGSIVTHELGHALGIGAHSDAAGDVMNGHPTATTPTEADASTLRYVLHRKVDIRL